MDCMNVDAEGETHVALIWLLPPVLPLVVLQVHYVFNIFPQ